VGIPLKKPGLAVATALLCGAVHAQTLYRCGNAYQDHPCESGTNQKVVGTGAATKTPSDADPASTGLVPGATDSRCRQRGIQAEKIMWAREGGATLAMQLADTEHPVNAALAADVYQRRGSASVVRRAIEADCLTEAARAYEAARLNAAASTLAGGATGDKDTIPQPGAAPLGNQISPGTTFTPQK
jgi:hypothetical protein